MIEDKEIRDKAKHEAKEWYNELLNDGTDDSTYLPEAYEVGYANGYTACQSEQVENKVDMEKLKQDFNKWYAVGAETEEYPAASFIFNFFLPHLQPQQPVESEAVEFINWIEDEGYNSVWSDKYKIRRWTKDDVYVNGSELHFDRLVKNGLDPGDLFTEFKNRKEKGL
jgi:hypothetical protein